MSPNRLIVVAGCERTGTSLMMQCLRDTGYYIGEKEELGGGYFRCEHKAFNALNRIIRKRGNILGRDARGFLEQMNVDAIKAHAPAVKFWLAYKLFRKAKYIRTIRNEHNVIDSLIARRAVKTRREGKLHYDEFMQHMECLNDFDHIFVKYEDMMAQPEKEAGRLAEFLEIERFSIKPINRDLWHYRPYEAN